MSPSIIRYRAITVKPSAYVCTKFRDQLRAWLKLLPLFPPPLPFPPAPFLLLSHLFIPLESDPFETYYGMQFHTNDSPS